MRASREQIIRNIAVILKHNPEKVAQLKKAQAITVYLTSDDGCAIDTELYRNGIARYIITGTRSRVTVTVKYPSMELTRKPRNEKPWLTDWVGNVQMSDIIRIYHDITEEVAK